MIVQSDPKLFYESDFPDISYYAYKAHSSTYLIVEKGVENKEIIIPDIPVIQEAYRNLNNSENDVLNKNQVLFFPEYNFLKQKFYTFWQLIALPEIDSF